MLNQKLWTQLEEMDAWNRENSRRALAIPFDEGIFLHQLALLRRPARILELGTSTGFSTLWLASAAAQYGGQVETVELDTEKIAIATAHFQRAGLGAAIRQVHADANAHVRELNGSYGLVFMDTEKRDYLPQFRLFWQFVEPGGAVAADNAVDLAEHMGDYLSHVKNLHGALSVTIPIGNGLELTCRTA